MDLRHHGKTEDAPPTFGAMEALDLAAVIYMAEKSGFPPPFIVYGQSYGGMVAQREAMDNDKIAGVICENPPAWPWDAIAVTVHPVVRVLENIGPIFDAIRQNALAVGHLINAAYGRDVLSEGDIRRFPASPAHHPLFLYGVGDLEHHNPAYIRQTWEHLYPEENAQFNTGPKDSPQQSKWFLIFPGVRHCEIPENIESKEKWWAEVHAFIKQVLERKGPSE